VTVAAASLTYRPATSADLDACAQIWRIAINDYLPQTGQPDMPDDVSGVRHLYDHLIATDPERFWVATTPDGQVVAFTAATLRDHVWFLSMLFVLPEYQRARVGQELLSRTMPAAGSSTTIAVGSDSAYPPSNGLYARLGMPARTPIWAVVGRPKPDWRPPRFGDGTAITPIAPDPEGNVEADLQDELDALDRETFGFARSSEHRYVRRDGRRGFTYRESAGGLLGYGYVATSGRIAPVAVRDAGLLGPVVGHLLTAYEPPGASAVWVTGHSDGAMAALLDAGLRLEGYPLLLGWSRPFADFARCMPVSPGLL
jgi:GNAT superfamily N-acetyltransferase